MSAETFSSNLSSMPKALQQACGASGLGSQVKPPADADVVLFEANGGASNALSAQSAEAVLERLRAGGRLLFTINLYPGRCAAWLSAALPCTGWSSLQRFISYVPKAPVPVIPSDPAFFRTGGLEGLTAPPGWDIRPLSAAERGQSRYERYGLVHPYTGVQFPPHSDLWSRSLLNRDWTVRACYDDIARSPLLLTGRYGAGRVAMLATTAVALGESEAAQVFWRSVIGWLAEEQAAPSVPPAAKPKLAMSFPSAGAVRLELGHPSHAALPVQLVTRVLDRNGAMLADGAGERQATLTLPPGRSTVLTLPLPVPAVEGLERNEAESSFLVRAGLLSADGSVLLAETRAPSIPAPLQLRIATESLFTAESAFSGPGAETLVAFEARMGQPVGAYAYPPGATVRGNVSLSLQNDNLAPLATVQDLAQPGNASVVALNDRGAAYRRGPADKIEGYGMWTGKAGIENVLQFTLPEPAHISAVTLLGCRRQSFAFGDDFNPKQIILELDGRKVASVDDLDPIFEAGLGQARITLSGESPGSVLTLRLPWVAMRGNQQRQAPQLGDISIEGRPASGPAVAPVRGTLTVDLVNALTGQRHPVSSQQVELSAGGTHSEVFSVELPQSASPEVYRLEGVLHAAGHAEPVIGSVPVLSLSPRKTLRDIHEITGPKVPGLGLIVTRGFREFLPLGPGTAETGGGWSTPDDLVWAYSRQFKELYSNAHTSANRLYASASDMRHYSMPWRSFGNGEPFFETCASGLVQSMKAKLRGWKDAPLVSVGFTDRWMLGPNLGTCNGWQDYVAFDAHLRESTGSGLSGRTHEEIAASLHKDHEDQWQAWQLTRYVSSVHAIREAFQAEGKEVVILGQGWPVVAGEMGRELAKTFRGMNDDTTWSMEDNSPTLTTGRTLGSLAFNPVWQIGAMLPWGFVSPIFNNWQWHSPVSTIEPQRRMLSSYLWRGLVWDDGTYGAAATFGFSTNVGWAYTMTAEEYQQWWYVQQRGSLLQPESPLGAGLVISTWKNSDPRSTRWNGADATVMPEVRLAMDVFRSLTEAGVSVPFSTNASTLGSWKPTPGASLIVLNLQDFNSEELQGLARVLAEGVRVVVFAARDKLSPSAASLAAHPGCLLIETDVAGLTHPQALELAGRLIPALEVPLAFSTGFAGYGFRCQDLNLIVVEDWREQSRVATVRMRKSSGKRHATAANLNDHSTLAVKDSGAFWEIAVPMRSGDAAMLAIREA